MPSYRAHPDPLQIAAAGLAVVALGLTALAAARPGDRDPWTVPAPPASVAAQPEVGGDVELTSRTLTGPSLAPGSTDVTAPRASPEWVADVSAATDIPTTALQAYADASVTVSVEAPSCRLGWTTLAAIGAIESGHGTHGGSALQPDGRAQPPIIGPALDGDQLAAIPSTNDSLALHGDPHWDHAVGPMQFIPSTWQRWGADGDGDGRDDPQDVDDAVLAAGRYLCAGGGDLAEFDGWKTAVLSYNHSQEYADQVLSLADAYGRSASVTAQP